MAEYFAIIRANFERVCRQIEAAALRSGRRASEVTLVAVTKYVDVGAARDLLAAGCADLGESRPQELWRKAEQLAGEPVRWHMIGHLQRNKVARTLPHVALLHSGDSLRLLVEVDHECSRAGRRLPVLLEVNVSGDASKHGFAVQEIEDLLPEILRLEHLDIRGLMAMARLDGDQEAARWDFRNLRALRDRLRMRYPAVKLDELSMGMSGDFEAAIEEGATIVRIGSALFEGIVP